MEGKEKIKTPKEMTEYEFLSTIYGETELLGEVHSKMIVRSIAELLEQRFEVVNEDVATIKSDNSKVIAALQAKLEKAKELIRKYQDREQVLAQQLDDYLVENHEMKKTLVAAKRTIEKLVVWADVASEDRKQFYEVIDKTLSSYNDNEKNKLTTFLEEK